MRYVIFIFLLVHTACTQKTEIVKYYPNGQPSSKVMLEKGVKNGKAILYYENGNVKEAGNWINDKQEGVWHFYYESGKLYADIMFSNGMQDGKSVYYYETDDTMSVSEFRRGKIEGETDLFYPNGNLQEASFWKNSKLNGWQVFYDTNGVEIKQKFFANGILKDSLLK
jgi:antitoxin component YwqK of YwqJK toxin-antitoxin module